MYLQVLMVFLFIFFFCVVQLILKGKKITYKYRIAGNFRGAHISRISRMGSNSRTLKSPKLISSLKVGVVYLLARVASLV